MSITIYYKFVIKLSEIYINRFIFIKAQDDFFQLLLTYLLFCRAIFINFNASLRWLLFSDYTEIRQ